jgi:hypothetical protein
LSLPFGLEFPLKLLDAGGQLLDLLVLGSVLRAQRINLPMQGIGPLPLLIGCMHERTQRRPAQVRTVADVRTSELMFGVEYKMHRRPFLGKRDALYRLSGDGAIGFGS